MQCIVLLSGGIDSTSLLAHVKHKWPEFGHRALSFNYAQRHSHELVSAAKVAEHYGLVSGGGYKLADIGDLAMQFMRGSSQTDHIAVPDGHYTDESMKVTVVPNRNMILLSIATAWAVQEKAQLVAYAAHAGDHAIYPDCRPEFAEAMAESIFKATDGAVQLYAPFLHMSKGAVIEQGAALKAPFRLTYSCYKGRNKHCGVCGTCVERKEAFLEAQVPDPTEYEE